MFWKIFIAAIVIYLALRFFFKFVLPLLRVTHAATRKINEMRQQMQEQQPPRTHPQPTFDTKKQNQEGDYIDFEEVKK